MTPLSTRAVGARPRPPRPPSQALALLALAVLATLPLAPPAAAAGYDDYHDVSEVEARLRALAANPAVELHEIGRSAGGRSIWVPPSPGTARSRPTSAPPCSSAPTSPASTTPAPRPRST